MKELTFPAKRAFNNMDKLFLERRQYLLNEYLTKLLKADFLRINPGLQESLLQFFDRGSYEHTKGSISRKVSSGILISYFKVQYNKYLLDSRRLIL